MGVVHFIGRACRLPQARDVESFSDILFNNKCVVRQIPYDRWNQNIYFHPIPGTKGKSYSFAAGVLDDIMGFDPKVFGISPREASQMDPQQRILLQVVWEALEDAAIVPSDIGGTHVGVYVGASSLDYGRRLAYDPEAADAYVMTGNTLSLVSNRISHAFDLRGPSLTVDTACSSSLVAMNEAVKALNSGEIDTAIVAGVNVLLDPVPFVGFSAARMLSPTGLCQPFSKNADGYVRSEGAVAFVLQRSTSLSDGPKRSHGHIVGIDVNADGRTVNVALPSAEGQSALLDRIYRKADITPDDLSFIEAHGTGTAVGDPIEALALGQALGQKRNTPLPIGSVKSNIGHLEPASGVAGVLKALIALEKEVLPASLHAQMPSEHIQFDELNLHLATKNLPLPIGNKGRFAGVSSFGFGGANAHLVIAGPAPFELAKADARKQITGERIFFTSAYCRNALVDTVAAYDHKLFDANGKTNNRIFDGAIFDRGTYPHRLAVLCDTADSSREALSDFKNDVANPNVFTSVSSAVDNPPVFVFSGNGAQYTGMSLEALNADKIYARTYRKINKRFRELAGWSIIKKLSADTLSEDMVRAEVAQPLLFADQIAMSEALIARGLKPAAVLGHSGGEVAAAYSCGAISLDQALQLNYARSISQEKLAGRGTMAALQASEQAAHEALVELKGTTISIAAVNSPKSVTLVGPEEEIGDFISWARRTKRWACVKLQINYPFHSPVQDEVATELRRQLAQVVSCDGHIPFYSSVTGGRLSGQSLDLDYWWANMRQPVKFMKALNAMQADGYKGFLEIGPQPVLASYMKSTFSEISDNICISYSGSKSNKRGVNPVLATYCRALVDGYKLDKTKIAQRLKGKNVRLPSYQWQNTEYRNDNTTTIAREMGNLDDYHPFLGKELNNGADIWVADIDTHLAPLLNDHVIGGTVVVPGSYFVEAALAAAQRALAIRNVELRDFDIVSPLHLTSSKITKLRTQVMRTQQTLILSSQSNLDEQDWRSHVKGRFGALNAAPVDDRPAPDDRRLVTDQDAHILYDAAAQVGMDYGENFRLVSHYRTQLNGDIEVVLKPSAYVSAPYAHMVLDPLSIDAIFHGLIAGLIGTEFAKERVGFVPIHIAKLRLFVKGATLRTGRIKIRKIGLQSVLADFECFDVDGRIVATLHGVRFRAVQLFKKINLATQSYGYHLAPAGQTTSPPIQLPLLGDIAQNFINIAQSATMEPDDDSIYLLEATARRIAFDAMSNIADADGFVTIDPKLCRNKRSYISNLLNILYRSNLANLVKGCWRVNADIDLPETNALLNGLLAERPDMIIECSLLSRLHEGLIAGLSGCAAFNTQEFFGHAALNNFRHGAVFSTRQRSTFAQFLKAILDKAPETRNIKVAELSNRSAQVLSSPIKEAQRTGVEFFTIDLSGDADAAAGIVDGAVSESTTTHLTSAKDIAEQGPFDVIVSLDSMHLCVTDDVGLADLRANMVSDAVFISVENVQSDFCDMVWGIDKEWLERSASKEFPQSMFEEVEDYRAILTRAGFECQELARLPNGMAGANLVCATPSHPKETPVMKTDRHVAVVQDFTQQFLQTLGAEPYFYSTDHDDDANIVKLSPPVSSPDKLVQYPLIFILPSAQSSDADQDIIEKRILYFASKLDALVEAQYPVNIVIPCGAGCASTTPNPVQMAMWAFMRTVKNEYPALNLKCIDVVDGLCATEFCAGMIALLDKATPETEIVIGDGFFSGLRVHQGIQNNGSYGVQKTGQALRTNLKFNIDTRLDDLSWHYAKRSAPRDMQVEVAVKAVGLNYRDVMWALNILPEEALESGFAGPMLGMECSGEIVRVGRKVKNLSVGDRVVTFGSGCFSSHLTVDQKWVGKLPDDIKLSEAATIPVAFFTAYYALKHLGCLEKGETVLIHGGAGGVGLAAIQIAELLGAKVIATAGSTTKRAFLKTIGVEHVLSSRSKTFAAEIEAITDGAGVDLVLNSLAGEAMELSLNSLKPFGRFLELGKQDFYSNTNIGLRALKANISYFGVDVDQLLAVKPDLSRRLFSKMMGLFQKGDLQPLPYRQFDGQSVVDAFRTMQRSDHIGKIVVKPVEPEDASVFAASSDFKPDPEGIHVIVGGLGGIGLETMEWLARLGAKKIALLSRSERAPTVALERIEKIRSFGVDVMVKACDVSDLEAVQTTFNQLRAHTNIRGIFHAAMVLEDQPINTLDLEVLRLSLAAKVAGARNLDQVTDDDTLDYFVMCSSIATTIGNHGQSAYVAANGYLEGLARSRVAKGLHALAVGWGPISDVGYLSRETDKAKLVSKVTGGVPFTAQQALQALEGLLSTASYPVIAITPMTWTGSVKALKTLQGPTYKTLQNLGQSQTEIGDVNGLRDILINLPARQADARLSGFLRKEIAHILRVPENSLSLTKPLSEYGMDSLMGVEMGLATQEALGDDIPMMSISDALSIGDISRKIIMHLHNDTEIDRKWSKELRNLADKHMIPDQPEQIVKPSLDAQNEAAE
jgi:acyl transferase domain-containing protein/NADPH:quinone reductase-like Zn-dependent oxidoreductase/acyl carrier protein